MLAARSPQTLSVCRKCCHSTLRAFMSLTEASIPPLRNRARPNINFVPLPTAFAALSHQKPATSLNKDFTTGSTVRNDSRDETSREARESENASTPEVPWYLQVQDVPKPEPTLLERQSLPELPADSPQQLQEILKHLSEGIGLESLSILDLRALDPPPALGSNLMMIIGSARSERHLNVSADRFCRWLRASYKLTPYADGLLGRNELKLKLRRRARRAKIMGGKPRPSDGDDGITVGWICVNIGTIAPAETQDVELRSDSGKVVGFGQNHGGINLVVQILTEEKREALQLEDLWTRHLQRQERKRLSESADAIESAGLIEISDTSADQDTTSADTIFPKEPPLSPVTTLGSFEQRRGFHMMSLGRAALRPFHESTNPRPKSLPQTSATSRETKPPPAETPAAPVGEQDQALEHLAKMSPREIREMLGMNWRDRVSTPFLKAFHEGMGLFPTHGDYRSWLRLMQLGQQAHHPGYTTAGMLHLLQEMQESLIAVPKDIFDAVIESVAYSGRTVDPEDIKARTVVDPLETVVQLWENMSLRGIEINQKDIVDTLFRATEATRKENPEAASEAIHPQIIAQLESLAHDNKSNVPGGVDTRLQAIKELIASHRWDALYRLWAGFPIREESRSAVLYTSVFHHVAQTKHQRACLDVLTRLVPTMALEEPPVAIEGEAAAAMLECLQVAVPDIHSQWSGGHYMTRPYVQLYEACMEGLDRSTSSRI